MNRKSIILSAIFVASLLAGCSGGPQPAIRPTAKMEAPQNNADPISLEPYLQEAAIASSNNQDYLEAATYWYALFQENPGDLNTALQCAYNMRYANNPGDAINVLTSALKTHPGNAQLLAERGKSYAALGNSELALEDMNVAAGANSADWTIHSARGVILDRLGRQSEAEDAYNKALGISPGNPVVLNNLALNLALAGRHEEAVATLQRAAEHPNATIQMRQNLSLLLALRGDFKQAGQLAQADLPNAMAQNNMMYFEGLSPEQ